VAAGCGDPVAGPRIDVVDAAFDGGTAGGPLIAPGVLPGAAGGRRGGGLGGAGGGLVGGGLVGGEGLVPDNDVPGLEPCNSAPGVVSGLLAGLAACCAGGPEGVAPLAGDGIRGARVGAAGCRTTPGDAEGSVLP
jgi:hypothetical protein